MLAAMTMVELLRLRLRGAWIFALSAGTLIWMINVVPPVAEFWAARAVTHFGTVRPISYLARRDPASCPGHGVERAECVEQAYQAQQDWLATKRAFQHMAWDIDLFLWSSLINLAIGLAPLLLVWANWRRNPASTESELY
jgi:hypothetical protein